MTIDEYKELMKFHLLLTNEDLTVYKYAAVSENGELYVYIKAPIKGLTM